MSTSSNKVRVRLLYGKHYHVREDNEIVKYVAGDIFEVTEKDLFVLLTKQKKVEVLEDEPVLPEELETIKTIPITKLNVSKVILGKLKSAGIKTANQVVEQGIEGLTSINGIGKQTAKGILEDARSALGL